MESFKDKKIHYHNIENIKFVESSSDPSINVNLIEFNIIKPDNYLEKHKKTILCFPKFLY